MKKKKKLATGEKVAIVLGALAFGGLVQPDLPIEGSIMVVVFGFISAGIFGYYWYKEKKNTKP